VTICVPQARLTRRPTLRALLGHLARVADAIAVRIAPA